MDRMVARAESRAGWRSWLAEAFVTVTVALITRELGVPEPRELRQALFGWAFIQPSHPRPAPLEKVVAALDWAPGALLLRCGRPQKSARKIGF